LSLPEEFAGGFSGFPFEAIFHDNQLHHGHRMSPGPLTCFPNQVILVKK
jgi:hypothetical protein